MKKKIYILIILPFIIINIAVAQLSSLQVIKSLSSTGLNCSYDIVNIKNPDKSELFPSGESAEWPVIFEKDLGSRFFVYVVRSNFYDFPMSYYDGWEGICRSNSKGIGIGGGYTFCFRERISFDFGFHYAGAEFTDWRIINRHVSYFIIDLLDFGYIIVKSKIPICVNLNFGGGVFHQSDYEGEISQGTTDPLEYLHEWDYPMRMGLDLKVGIIKYCMLKCSYHYYSKGGSGDTNPNVVVVNPNYNPELDRLGYLLSFGLEFYLDPFK